MYLHVSGGVANLIHVHSSSMHGSEDRSNWGRVVVLYKKHGEKEVTNASSAISTNNERNNDN